MKLTEEIKAKWSDVVNHPDLPQIPTSKKAIVTRILENTQQYLDEASTNSTGGMDVADPVLISMVRRVTPNLMHFDFCGVQPMNAATGLIFAIRSRYGAQPSAPFGTPGDARQGHTVGSNNRENWAEAGYAPNEAGYFEADTDYSGTGTHNPGYPAYSVGTGMNTKTGERLGGNESGDGDWQQMSFTIEKASVEAKTRALRAEYTIELAQDLRAYHGLDAEAELTNICSGEILVEQNREIIGTVRRIAKLSAPSPLYDNGTIRVDSNGNPVMGGAGVYNIDTNSDGRWQAEKFKSLLFKVNQEANAIAKDTRRGRGNLIIASSDVIAMLDLAGKIDYAPAVDNNLHADDTGATFVGTMGRFKVYCDPYVTYNEIIVGYKGSSQMDAGLFYCPYQPLTMSKVTSYDTHQPSLGFKARYGIVANPFTTLKTHGNSFFRKTRILGV